MDGRYQNERSISCKACGKVGHTVNKCWTIVAPQKEQVGMVNPKWNYSKPNYPEVAINVSREDSGLLHTRQQLDQIARAIPAISTQMQIREHEADKDIDAHLSGMISCFQASCASNESHVHQMSGSLIQVLLIT